MGTRGIPIMTMLTAQRVAVIHDEPSTTLSDDLLALVHSYMDTRRAAAGIVLFTEGDPGEGAYIIRRGEVRVVRSQSGEVVELARRGPGDPVGESALLDGSARTATAVCETDCELYLLSPEGFQEITAAHEAIAWHIFQVLNARLHGTNSAPLREPETHTQELEAGRAWLAGVLGQRDPVLAAG